jgi:hypothetical protein
MAAFGAKRTLGQPGLNDRFWRKADNVGPLSVWRAECAFLSGQRQRGCRSRPESPRGKDRKPQSEPDCAQQNPYNKDPEYPGVACPRERLIRRAPLNHAFFQEGPSLEDHEQHRDDADA